MTDARVLEYLRDNDYPEHIVRDGKPGLVRRWREFVEDVERGYSMGLEDYRNDLDVRAILAVSGAEDDEIRALDERVKKVLVSPTVRVWESAAGDPFWDFGYPGNARQDLVNDLRTAGLIES